VLSNQRLIETVATKRKKRSGPGRLSNEDAALLTDRILDAALALFLENGYEVTSMKAIARKAGASTKTLYSRYANKSEVLAAAGQRILDRSLEQTPSQLPDSDSGDVRKFVETVGREFGSLYGRPEPPRMMRLAFSEAHRHPDLARFFVGSHVHVVDRIAERLERWHREGKLPRLRDARMTAMILIEMVASVPRTRSILGQPLSRKETEAYIATGVDIFLAGLGFKG
jgi:TetR/AcrR family transcriptional regulator, mexJK operon transcriptional repressor